MTRIPCEARAVPYVRGSGVLAAVLTCQGLVKPLEDVVAITPPELLWLPLCWFDFFAKLIFECLAPSRAVLNQTCRF